MWPSETLPRGSLFLFKSFFLFCYLPLTNVYKTLTRLLCNFIAVKLYKDIFFTHLSSPTENCENSKSILNIFSFIWSSYYTTECNQFDLVKKLELPRDFGRDFQPIRSFEWVLKCQQIFDIYLVLIIFCLTKYNPSYIWIPAFLRKTAYKMLDSNHFNCKM